MQSSPSPSPLPPPLLTTAAAAARCGFGYTTFLRLRTAGQTPPPDSWKGKRPFYAVEAIDAWLRARGGKATWRLTPPIEGGIVAADVEDKK